jgi:hypothetical protein
LKRTNLENVPRAFQIDHGARNTAGMVRVLPVVVPKIPDVLLLRDRSGSNAAADRVHIELQTPRLWRFAEERGSDAINPAALLTQLYQLAPLNGNFSVVRGQKRESNQRRPIANRV